MTEIEQVKRELAELKDTYIKQTKTLNDLLLNLDFDNMPRVKRSIMRYVNGTNESIASIMQAVDENGAEIELVAQHVTKVQEYLTEEFGNAYDAIGTVQEGVEENAKNIKSVTETTAQIKQEADENSAKIALIVKTVTTEDGQTVSYVDGGIIIEAINGDESQVTISGDKINIEGVASFVTRDELANGSSGTVIDGGLIKAETLDVNSLKTSSDTGFYGIDVGTPFNMAGGDLSYINFVNMIDATYGWRTARAGFIDFDGGKYHGMEGNHPMLIRTGPAETSLGVNQIIIAAGLGGTAAAPTYNAPIYMYGTGLYFNNKLIAN